MPKIANPLISDFALKWTALHRVSIQIESAPGIDPARRPLTSCRKSGGDPQLNEVLASKRSESLVLGSVEMYLRLQYRIWCKKFQ